jgi:hypothetical protein
LTVWFYPGVRAEVKERRDVTMYKRNLRSEVVSSDVRLETSGFKRQHGIDVLLAPRAIDVKSSILHVEPLYMVALEPGTNIGLETSTYLQANHKVGSKIKVTKPKTLPRSRSYDLRLIWQSARDVHPALPFDMFLNAGKPQECFRPGVRDVSRAGRLTQIS